MPILLQRILLWLPLTVAFAVIMSLLLYNIEGQDYLHLFIYSQATSMLVTYAGLLSGDITYRRNLHLEFVPAMLVVVPVTVIFTIIAMAISMHYFTGEGRLPIVRNSFPESLTIYVPFGLMIAIITVVTKRLHYLKAHANTITAQLEELTKTQREKEAPGLAIRAQGSHYLIPFSDIVYVASHGDRSVIHTKEKDYEAGLLLKEVGERLPAGLFIRIHRGYIVNLEMVSHIQYFIGGRYTLYLKDGDDSNLPVGRSFAPALKDRMGVKQSAG